MSESTKTLGLLAVNEDGVLRCPWCGDERTNFDGVAVLNATGQLLQVLADGAGAEAHLLATLDAGEPEEGVSAHVIVLTGDCQGCRSALMVRLQQDQGRTQVTLAHSIPEA